MSTTISSWRPSWWSDEVHGSAWDRVKEAMRRDWMQTKHDLHVGGHEMNQSVADTLNQATGVQHLPGINEANPPKVIGDWHDAEVAYRYGHAARAQLGAQHPAWSAELERTLGREWTAARDHLSHDWAGVKHFVRR